MEAKSLKFTPLLLEQECSLIDKEHIPEEYDCKKIQI